MILVVIVIIAGTIFVQKNPKSSMVEISSLTKTTENIPKTYTKKIEITEGKTYGILMTDNGIGANMSQEIFTAAQELYDLSKIRLGRAIELVYDIKTDELVGLNYKIDTEEELLVALSNKKPEEGSEQISWQAKIKPIPYEIKIKTASGTIETCMYESALEQELDERVIIEFADVLQWSVDFAWEVRKGDSYKFIFEERYLDNEYVMPGKILAGKFINEGENLYAFYYEESEESKGYFNELGESVEKIFLKAPLAFKYISSGYTTGNRYIQAFNISTKHRAIDYAANYGTPIRSVGDGTIVYAGWNGSCGRKISVRHSSVYQTNYCHLSKIAVQSGQKVTQGETIGYVGSSGFSTGPHLHYEMAKNGTLINPLTEILPPSESIEEENKAAYLEFVKDLKNRLDGEID